VIGADQLLVCGSEWFDKPEDLVAARRQLWALRGRTHVLETAVCAVKASERLWGRRARATTGDARI
jgi:septum formation protein